MRPEPGSQDPDDSVDRWRAQMLIADMESSIAFVSIFFAVSLGLLAVLLTQSRASSPAVVMQLVVVCSSLYSAVFYAVVGGKVTRLNQSEEAEDAIVLGNALSEYFGLYVLSASLPLVVLDVTDNVSLGATAWAINAASLGLYKFSRHDLLERAVKRKGARYSLTTAFFTLSFLLFTFQSLHSQIAAFTALGGLLALQLLLAVLHIRSGESSDTANDTSGQDSEQ